MTDLLSNVSLWELLGWTMLHFLWMGCVAFAIAAGVRWLVRGLRAERRYFAALFCLVGVAATAAAAVMVSWQQINASAREIDVAATKPISAVSPTTMALDWPHAQLLATSRSAVAEPPDQRLTASEALRDWILEGTLSVIALLLPWLWVCGTPIVALALLTGIIGTSRLRRRSQPVTDEQLLNRLQNLRQLLRISRRVALGVSDQVSSPLVVGILRPLIVLPPSLISGLAPAQLEMILLHELAHVRRWDNLINLLQCTLEAVLFFHPVVWWASRWVRLEREHCCDALVLSHDHSPQSYAETLAALALPEMSPQFATAAMANHQLTSRICHILNVKERTMGISIRTLLGCIVVLAAGAGGFLLATLRPDRVAADDPVPAVQADEQEPERSGRLMFGAGVNSDAGVVGQIMLDDGSEAQLALGAKDGLIIGESLAAWGRVAWSPNEATGPPDVPEAGDSEHAWASLTEDGQVEWLRLTFEKPVRTAAVIVYESYNPGALYKVTSVDSEGAEFVVWEGDDPVAVQDGKGVSIVMPPQPLELSQVTLHINSPEVKGWNEIDAVGLIDRVTGEVHWATGAEASSSYADRAAWTQADYYHHFLGGLNAAQRCEDCHANVHGSAVAPPGSTRQRIEQLRSELQRLEWELIVEELLNSPQSGDTREYLNRVWEEIFQRDSNNRQAPSHELEPSERQALEDWIKAGREWQPSADAANTSAAEELQELSQFRAELQRLEAELARERALRDQALAERQLNSSPEQLSRQALDAWLSAASESGEETPQTASDAYREWVLRLLNEPEPDAADEASQFEELKNSLLEQQQAIEKLTDILEQLQQRLNAPDTDAEAEPDAQSEGPGIPIQIPGVGPAPQALDFAFPVESGNAIDELILERLRNEGLQPAVSDEEFLRRIYLDLLGRPPTVEETRQFLDNDSDEARQELIDNLLGSRETADHWEDAWSFYFGLQQ